MLGLQGENDNKIIQQKNVNTHKKNYLYESVVLIRSFFGGQYLHSIANTERFFLQSLHFGQLRYYGILMRENSMRAISTAS